MKELKMSSNAHYLNQSDISLLEDYYAKYGYKYDNEMRFYLQKNLIKYMADIYEKDEMPPAFYSQIYSHCKILPQKHNMYFNFFQNLMNEFPDLLDKNTLEVACGYYPALVELIANEIKKQRSKGTIAGIDYSLIDGKIEGLEDIKLYKAEFSINTDVSRYNFLTGLLSCEATPLIIKKACLEEKEMSVVPCTCVHPIDGIRFSNFDRYIEYLTDYIETNRGRDYDFIVDKELEAEDYNFPILSLKKKEKSTFWIQFKQKVKQSHPNN